MKRMEGAYRRALRLNRSLEEGSYFVGMVGNAIISTDDIFKALDFTKMDDNQVGFLMDKIYKLGFPQSHFVTFGCHHYDEYNTDDYYEKEFKRATIEELMAVAEDDYKELIGEDE